MGFLKLGWEGSDIGKLSETCQEEGAYAQCMDGCGWIFRDDLPVFTCDLPCPHCKKQMLYRKLRLKDLLGKDKFPKTWTPAGHLAYSENALNRPWREA
jgi:hypothetical protein